MQKPTGVSREKIRTDKEAYLEELAKEAEEAAQKGEQTMNVYKIRRRRRSRMSIKSLN